ncbi:MAG: hypothetical protein K0S04_1738 [Herbinix sp.]|nr:hypothetical protein [Herbinix sp.]
MRAAKQKKGAVIGVIALCAIIVLTFYYYLVNHAPTKEAQDQTMTETEKIIAYDLDADYPQTPRETVKLFARIMKALYDNPEDREIEPLALKIRELYDEEFLDSNPQETYLSSLKSDISGWKESDRRITNYLLVNEDLEQEKELEGVKYSVNYVSYTIQENGKFTETWKVLLRQDKENKWRILGWEYVPEEE